MSVYAIGQVFRHCPYKDPFKLLLMLALADWSDDHGRCYPGIETLAEKVGLSGRSVQRHLRGMEKDGYLTISYNGGRKTNLYTLKMDLLATNPIRYGRGDTVTPVTQLRHPSGDTSCHPSGDRALSPDTSVDTSVDTMSLTLSAPEQKILIIPTETYESIVEEIFNIYVTATKKHPKVYTLTEDRRRKGMARFHDALKMASGDVEEARDIMLLAIQKLVSDPWHNGTKDKQKHWDWTDQLMRTPDRFQKVLSL